MKVAIYSRVLEVTQQKDIQVFFDELDREGIVPVVFQPFLDEINSSISLPSTTTTFISSQDLTPDIDFFVSLG
ncbi:MAG TPA: NAD(+) kinase, partial [Chitinophagaceae bacterium]|nr:NAD(+) kinase [Chitinophagaceae bacterium]